MFYILRGILQTLLKARCALLIKTKAVYWLVRSLPPATFCMWGRWESGPAWRVSSQPTSSPDWMNQWVCVLEIKRVYEKGCDRDLGLRRTNEISVKLLKIVDHSLGEESSESGTATEAPI